MPTSDQLVQGVTDYFIKVIQDQDYSLMRQMLSQSYSFNGSPNTPEANETWIRGLHKKYPNFTVDIQAIYAANNVVGLHWRAIVPANAGRAAGYLSGINMITCDRTTGQAVENVQVGDMELQPLRPANSQ